jgi:N-acetylmuramoyl-L-alanine amidase
MSAAATKMSPDTGRTSTQPAADSGATLQQGNRVLASIANQDAMHSLVAFSELHEEILRRRSAPIPSDRDLFETERFLLDEVLQLICTRLLTLTAADGIVIALPKSLQAESFDASIAAQPDEVANFELISRAAAGPLALDRGFRLIGESAFLEECLKSNKILRSDDCSIDARVIMDIARLRDARSTVLVPLRGARKPVGVLQAFSGSAWAFTDQHLRTLDLFAELVLAALKPSDQDRRINWLAGVADDLLGKNDSAAKKEAAAQTIAGRAVIAEHKTIESAQQDPIGAPTSQAAPPQLATSEQKPGLEAGSESPAVRIERPITEPKIAQPVLSSPVEPKPIASSMPSAIAPVREAPAGETPAAKPAASTCVPLSSSPEIISTSAISIASTRALDARSEAVTIPPTDIEIGDAEIPPVAAPEEEVLPRPITDLYELSDDLVDQTNVNQIPAFLADRNSPSRIRFRPGWNMVVALIAVAALFSAGAWWGMEVHGKSSNAPTAGAPHSITTPPAPPSSGMAPTVSDNLTTPDQSSSDVPLSAVPDDKLATLPKITGVRHWASSMGSTVVIDMEDNVPYEVHRLMSPERIYFDLHDTVLSPDLAGKTMDVGDSALTRVRVAQPVAGVTRVVLDTKDGSNFSVSMESNPYRLIVELKNTDQNLAIGRTAPKSAALTPIAPHASSAVAPNASRLTATSQPIPAKTGKFRIVLDAGHGGWDLGTVGRQGLLEKDLVLDVTERLGQLLRTRLGTDVVFTRSNDTYLPLDQRADIANQAQADLFVSVHANYSTSAEARGVETYYTNLFSAPGSKEIEKREDGSLPRLTPVSLSPSGLHEKIEESRKLAASVQHSLYTTLAASSPDIRDRGTKDASFAVLTGTAMPAILTEISFVSSPADEQKLQSTAYRQQIAEALYQGIARYQQTSPKAKLAQLQHPRNNIH